MRYCAFGLTRSVLIKMMMLRKMDQVQMMRAIYQQGSRTLAWLGSSSHSITRGFSIIPKLLKASKASQARNGVDTSQDSAEISSHFTPRLSEFLSIFELPYFARIWIIQEVAVSPSIEVFCGHHSISWDDLEDAITMSYSFGTEAFSENRSLALFWNISDARTRFQTKAHHNLLRLLITHRGTSATCTKDKIYALLGLLDPGDLQGHGIVPNYRDEYTVEEACIDTADSILRTSGNLDLLSVPSILPSVATPLQLPTWVLDWSRPPSSFSFIRFSTGPSLAATGSSTSHPIFRDEERKVVGLLGYVFDKVACVGYASANRQAPFASKIAFSRLTHQFLTNIQFWRFEAKNLRTWKSWLHFSGALSRGAYVTGEPMLDAFWKTFMAMGGNALRMNLRWRNIVKHVRTKLVIEQAPLGSSTTKCFGSRIV